MFGVLDIVLIMIVALAVVLCAIRGFAKSVAGFVRLGISFLLAKLFSPMLGAFLQEKLIGPRLHQWLEGHLYKIAGDLGEAVRFDALLQEGSEFRTILSRFCTPEQIALLEEQYGGGTLMTQEKISELASSVAETWGMRFSIILAAILIFIVAFVLLLIVTMLLITWIEHVQALKKANHWLGALFGLASGACTVIGLCWLCEFVAGVIALMGGNSEALLNTVNSAALVGPIYRFVTTFLLM